MKGPATGPSRFYALTVTWFTVIRLAGEYSCIRGRAEVPGARGTMGQNQTPTSFHVLLIEDREGDAFLTRELLEGARHPIVVHAVPDGIEALAFLRRQGVYHDRPRPDL